MTRHRAIVWLDRDGTLVDDPGYLRDPDALRLLPGAAAAVRALNEAGITVVLVTNQSGIGRGLMATADVLAVHQRLRDLLGVEGARIDAIYVCPHVPGAIADGVQPGCGCRKPAPGLVERARRDLGIGDVPEVVIGDRAGDLGLARNIGASAVLLLSGDGQETLGKVADDPSMRPDHVCDDVLTAARWWIERLPAREVEDSA